MKYGIIIPICGVALLVLVTNSLLSGEPRSINRTVERAADRSRAAAASLAKSTKRHLDTGAKGVGGFLAQRLLEGSVLLRPRNVQLVVLPSDDLHLVSVLRIP